MERIEYLLERHVVALKEGRYTPVILQFPKPMDKAA